MINNKVKLSLIGICAVLLLIFFAKNVTQRINSTTEPIYDSVVKYTDDGKVSRSYFAKMISMLQYSKKELESLEPVSSFTDVEDSAWYSEYINGIANMKVAQILVAEEGKFHPEKNISYQECQKVVETLATDFTKEQIAKEVTGLYPAEKAEEDITWADFLATYNFLVQKVYGAKEGATQDSAIQTIELYVVGTSSNVESLKESGNVFTTVTDLGEYSNDGLVMDEYIDCAISACVKDSEILYVDNVVEKETKLSNVWILGQDGTTLRIYVNGVERAFEMNNKLDQDITSNVADVVVSEQKIKSINLKPEKVRAKVLVAKEDYIELEDYGKIPVDENYRIYKVYGQVAMEMTSAILVGYDTTDFIMADGKICAALITEQVEPQNIRVILHDTNYSSLYHKKVTLTSDQEFVVYYGDKEKKYKAGKEITLTSSSDLMKNGRVRVETTGEDGKIEILSIQRKGSYPSYRGAIEVETTSSGLTLINELPLEEYLYAVIPSEMPITYGLEALKVQAVCARSYAYNHLLSNSCSKYGAHVDDSTSYQVYNAQPESEDSINAVKQTYGQVLEYDNQVIFAYYFSTSCGYTADVSNVWLTNSDMPYLKAVFQGADSKIRDYSTDAAFREFITKNTEDTFESEFPWYRWSVTIDYTDLKKMVDHKLSSLYKKKEAYVLTLDSDGTYKEKSIDTVGSIKNIKVSRRETSGLATEIIIEGSKNTVKIKSESFIRQILRPSYDEVVRQDGSKISNLSLLPSAFFVIDKVKSDGSVTGIKLSGGGYGHGVGMSQNGVKALAEEGKTYEEILKHYYNDIEIASIY